MAHAYFNVGLVLAIIGFLAWIAAVVMTAVAATQTPPDTTLLWATFGVNLGGFIFAVVGLCMMWYAVKNFWRWYMAKESGLIQPATPRYPVYYGYGKSYGYGRGGGNRSYGYRK